LWLGQWVRLCPNNTLQSLHHGGARTERYSAMGAGSADVVGMTSSSWLLLCTEPDRKAFFSSDLPPRSLAFLKLFLMWSLQFLNFLMWKNSFIYCHSMVFWSSFLTAFLEDYWVSSINLRLTLAGQFGYPVIWGYRVKMKWLLLW